MKGVFKYLSKDEKVITTHESSEIPEDAMSLILFHVYPPPEPHTQEDHDNLHKIEDEFDRLYTMIYGHEPPKKGMK